MASTLLLEASNFNLNLRCYWCETVKKLIKIPTLR